ncbi:Phosphoserine phosphatase RsbP [Salinivirga cyanobacteriivorans]|uniref:Phosphoserine phosphatase RsbP n=1 Tax=Salinivirga cyanobacteriivorans TaxID=1307839 RepID=A0A0S2HXN9_9BACT|nr:tetratricopeptide repeat protein [Salinivirga cyanobacteriivorans]ALO14815.1 Phosphoserine phosphatase RsbP [Salinivirga cyanobacteriivorans]
MKFVYALFFITLAGGLCAQTETIDSLKNTVENYQADDTVKVNLMQDLAEEFLAEDMEKAIEWTSKSIKLSEKLSYSLGFFNGWLLKGSISAQQSANDSAILYFNKAVGIAKNINNNSALYNAYNQIGLFFRQNEQFDSTLHYYEKALNLIDEKNSDDRFYLLQQIAVVHYNLGNFETTIEFVQKGIKLSKQIGETDHRMGFINLMAASLKRKGDIDSALYYFRQIVELTDDEENFDKLSAYNNIANIYGDRGNYPKALDYYLLTLKTAEKLEHERAMSVTYNNIAIVYYTLKDYPQTIKYLQKSLSISQKVNDKPNIVNTMNNIGELYLKQDSLVKALKYYNEASKIIKRIKAPYYLTHNLLGKAAIFDKQNINDSAKHYYNEALELTEKLNAREERADSHIGLAEFYLKRGKYELSSKHAEKAFQIARELGKVETIREAAGILHRANAKLVKIQEAYKYLKVYTEMNDSLLNADNTKEITQLEMQYQHEKELQEIEAQEAIREAQRQKEIARQKGIRNAFIVAFVLVVFIVVLVVRYSRQKQKANSLLAYQKAEIEEKNEELQQLMGEISRQKDQIESSHNQITDSIRYAEKIQNALFPIHADLKQYFKDFFIYYQPLKIVSGDFYWVEKVHNHLLIAVADCTGHGVPGAMMSMLGISYLNDITRQPEVKMPEQVLEKMRNRVKRSLHQTGDVREARDGMDLAFIDIDVQRNSLNFAGANNPMIIIRNGEVIEFEPDKQPISVYQKEQPFHSQSFQLKKDDSIYLFTDGYRDQFKGAEGKKYGKKRFLELLISIHTKPFSYQKTALEKEMQQWMGEKANQIDDILVTGFKW